MQVQDSRKGGKREAVGKNLKNKSMSKGPGIGYNHGANIPLRCTKGHNQLAEMGPGVTKKVGIKRR